MAFYPKEKFRHISMQMLLYLQFGNKCDYVYFLGPIYKAA